MVKIISRKVLIAGVSCFSVIAAVVIWLVFADKQEYTIERNIRYGFTVQNTTNQLMKHVDLYIHGPAKKTSSQLVNSISASQPYKLEADDLGNQILHFTIDVLPPFATRIININAQVMLSDAPNDVDIHNSELFLSDEKFVEINDEKIIALASKFPSNSLENKAESLFKWVHSNIKYSGYVKDDRGARFALKHRTGDCTEFMYLYTALARISGIPARGIGGYIYSEDAVLKQRDFHNWVEVYLDGAWRIVDPQNGSFLENESHFIAMRVLSESAGNKIRLYNTHQFASSSENILINMN